MKRPENPSAPRSIRCDGCGKEMPETGGTAERWGEETLYFCSAECAARQRVPEQIEIDEDEERGG